ncbi:hypothetical protein BU24DRAFT_493198 [Aaosphaeria arxii CBS 175.79]|uniref:EthD domain-containing protein n=1 Tax=Aaosphaeria arxii CBS 175.79 TaxID=1450172 RepID=A0A6A5XN25_9PLEO|nr:uncharacterized protein BU24DRAFT_493198 [Aaosphaeria arxii CBS 175.79]KAF2014638.1 hypothetical protein BU24DRAFT_493198 [Aaosphaeria arxii CBS 175.79]
MPPGVLWVSSRILPSAPTLAPQSFCTWYEETHIQEVTSLPGVPRAARYEALSPQPSPTTWSSLVPWLTVYEMPDVDYRSTEEFKELDGQSRPGQELLEGVFRQARFDTRFCEEVQWFENPVSSAAGDGETSEEVKKKTEGPAKFLISAALQPADGEPAHADFDRWYREEHLAFFTRAPGYRRSRRYRVVDATALDGFERIRPEVPCYLALHEFDGEELPWGVLRESAETEWARRVMGGLVREEVGWYRLKRRYGEW